MALAFSSTPCFPAIVDAFEKTGFKNFTVVVGLYNTSYTLGGAIGPLFAASLIHVFSARNLVVILAFFLISCAPLVWWGRPKGTVLVPDC